MEDYLNEKEQWEAVKTWLKENGTWIVAGVALGGLALAGYRAWQAHGEREALEASAQYGQVLKAFDKGDEPSALSALGQLERAHPSSAYVDQAHLAEARIYVQEAQFDKAAATLKSVMDKTRDEKLALVARLRLARVQMAQGKLKDAETTLDGAQPGAFDGRYHEARGDLALAKGDKAAALKEYQAARLADAASGETTLLDLKINDLTPATAKVE